MKVISNEKLIEGIGPITMEDTAKLISKYIKKSDIKYIIDCGCNDGTDTEKLQQLYPRAKIFGIEGSKKIYNEFINKNKLKITYINEIIFDEEKEVKFFIEKGNPKGARSGLMSGHLGEDFEARKSIRMDTLCKNISIPQIDLIKIDCEGGTWNVLNSMGELLKGIKVMHIETEAEEYFKGQVLKDKVNQFLKDNGFILLKYRQAFKVKQFDEIWINKDYYNE